MGACPTGSWWHFDRSTGGPDNDRVNAIAFDGEGRGYFGTGDLDPVESEGGGLSVRHPDGRWERFRAAEWGLGSNTVYSVWPTRSGVLVGTLKGAHLLGTGTQGQVDWTWTALPEQPVLPFTLADVTDITEDREGRQWFATTYGLFVWDGEVWDRHGTSSRHPGLESRFITAVVEGPDGRIWAGTHGKGVAVLEHDGSWTGFRATEGGLGNDYVYDIAFDHAGRAWFGTGIGVSVFDGADWTVYTPADSPLPDEDVRTVAVDDRGWIWLGTHEGLAVVDGDTWRRCPAMPVAEAATGDVPAGGRLVQGLVHPLVVAADPGPDGSMWFGTFGGGVSVWWPGDR